MTGKAARLGLAMAGCLLVAPAVAGDFDALPWLTTDTDKVAFLTEAPPQCLADPQSSAQAWRIGVGRTAFRSPSLLGGQAARYGFSCNSCHRNGHDNPSFFLPGLSDTAGRVDVTATFFNETRDDHITNPVPIPSLLDVGGKVVFGTVIQSDRLDIHLRDIITAEFEGKDPPKAVFEGLLAYLGALQSAACGPAPWAAHDFETDWAEVMDIYHLTLQSLATSDRATTNFLVSALRQRLGIVARSFDGTGAAVDTLVQLSRGVALLGMPSSDNTPPAFAALRIRLDQAAMALRSVLAASLYNRDLLASYLDARDRDQEEAVQ